ncbi:MAG: patatin-like phospholipase family protein [Leptothrix sp. (in: b-proteobacteria)]
MTLAHKKYGRCLVLAGGGGRLGTHLGTYAAACEAGAAPDLVLGTCGGALIAALIHAESDPARQLDFLAGPEMYRFWCSARTRREVSVPVALAGLIRRALDRRHAPYVPDLDRDALFEFTGHWPSLEWRKDGAGTDAVLLGARILYPPTEVGRRRAGRALLEPVAIGPLRACSLLEGTPCPTGSGPHVNSAIEPNMATLRASELPLQDAVRISLTDMVYLQPTEAAGARWLGGVVDLMPVELASRLADEVWTDHKDPVPRWTMAPAWRAVLGIDAGRRQRQVDLADVALRVDNRGLSQALPESVLERRLALSRSGLQLILHACASESDYRRVILAQFNEGRRRTLAAIANR